MGIVGATGRVWAMSADVEWLDNLGFHVHEFTREAEWCHNGEKYKCPLWAKQKERK